MDPLYDRASRLRPQVMKTPQELLRDAISESGLTPTEVGRRLGFAHPYQAIHDLLSGKRKFSEDKQSRIAAILGLPSTYFSAPDETRLRAEYIAAQWQAFLQTELAKQLAPDDLRTLERIGRAFIGEKLPTAALFAHFALVLHSNYTTEQLRAALARNERLDQAIADEDRKKLNKAAVKTMSGAPKGRGR